MQFLFGAELGDPVADQIYQELMAHTDGMSKTELFALFTGNRSAGELNRALHQLQSLGLVNGELEKSGGRGRPREVWKATRKAA